MPDQIIRLARLRVAWPRQKLPLLDIASLDVARDERLFMRGASGSGKLTLPGLITGVIAPQSGVIEVLGQTLEAINAAAKCRSCA